MGKGDSFIYTMITYQYKDDQKISKKKQITAREYIEYIEQKDPFKKQVKKTEKCFIYKGQYFLVQSFININGKPNILRIETTGDETKIDIPPFVRVLKEVTDDKNYETN